MILRKPYAFLIKYFKLIHICLFILFGYLLFKLRDIYTFFREYVKNDVYTYIDNIASEYIGVPLFLIAVFILILGIAIFQLMRKKEKPVLFYRVLIVYSFLLFIALIVYNNFYISLEYEIYERTVVSIYRDVIGFFYYLNYAFVAITFVRGFGFDIKKFSFEKDLKELNISDEDSEEFELSVNVDKEVLVSNIRKEKRLIGYYIKENLITLSIILIIGLIIAGIYIYNSFIVTNIVYEQNKVVLANNIEFLVNHSYFTSKNKSNQDLGINYVIVNLNVTNKQTSNIQLNLMRIRLKIGNHYFYPVTNQYSNFDDLGVGYKNNSLKSNVINNYILVFKIDKDIVSKKNIVLQLFDHEEYNGNVVKSIYRQIRLKTFNNTDTLVKTIKINEDLYFENTIWGKGSLKITKYEINNKYVKKYEECINEVCQKYDKVIQNSMNNDVIKINYNYNDINSDVFENNVSFMYETKGTMKTIDENMVNVLYSDKDTIFLGVDRYLKSADKIIMLFNVRGSVYQVLLKDNG